MTKTKTKILKIIDREYQKQSSSKRGSARACMLIELKEILQKEVFNKNE